jgi:hypothetical protein
MCSVTKFYLTSCFSLRKAEVNIHPSVCVLNMLEVPDLNLGTGTALDINLGSKLKLNDVNKIKTPRLGFHDLKIL